MILVTIGEIDLDYDLLDKKLEQVKSIGARRVGFQTREIAMNSITQGAGPSKPGQPPHGHTGVLKRFIRYEYEEGGSLAVGPALLSRKSKDAAKATEHGGTSRNVRGKTIRVRARPFMSPAFNQVVNSSVPEVFENTFRE